MYFILRLMDKLDETDLAALETEIRRQYMPLARDPEYKKRSKDGRKELMKLHKMYQYIDLAKSMFVKHKYSDLNRWCEKAVLLANKYGHYEYETYIREARDEIEKSYHTLNKPNADNVKATIKLEFVDRLDVTDGHGTKSPDKSHSNALDQWDVNALGEILRDTNAQRADNILNFTRAVIARHDKNTHERWCQYICAETARHGFKDLEPQIKQICEVSKNVNQPLDFRQNNLPINNPTNIPQKQAQKPNKIKSCLVYIVDLFTDRNSHVNAVGAIIFAGLSFLGVTIWALVSFNTFKVFVLIVWEGFLRFINKG